MVNVDCVIYCDALSILFSDKANLKELVEDQMCQSDYETDCICNELELDYRDRFSECDIKTIMKYVSINENQVTFDYGESEACGDLRCVAFRVPICFNEYEFIKEECK